jgi:predicted 3-demethylubiquinone-9 3-methyltransferase (glyoxalase superfamily)
MTSQKIVPHLWFDKEAKEAAGFYTSIFPRSRLTNVTTLHDTPSGDCDVVSFELAEYQFMAISAGPLFKLNPSISFLLNFDTGSDPRARETLDALWERLSDGGTPLMPLDKYPFSEHYGWIQDKYGLSWQLILTEPGGGEWRPFIVPFLMFTGERAGRAKEAIGFYTSVFNDARRGVEAPYGPGMEPDREGTLMFADFMLENQWFAAMDSAHEHNFAFNEGISLLINCETQAEIDAYWEKLSADPESEQCGWLKDRFGVSWQVSPTALDRMMSEGSREQVDRVTQAFLPMKKLDLAEIQRAYEGAA